MADAARIVELDQVIADGDQQVVDAVVERVQIALNLAATASADASGSYADGLADAARLARRIIPVRSRPQPSSAARAVDSVRALLPFLDGDAGPRVAAALDSAPVVASVDALRKDLRGEPSPTNWADLFSGGRVIFYEGDDPDGFVATVRREFGFDPSADSRWGEQLSLDEPPHTHITYAFLCPPGLMDAIYGSDRWPMGS
jgi:hypothetical protein